MFKIKLEKDQQLFFTSDTHYNHANICRGTTNWTISDGISCRDFDTLDEMNNRLVNNINEVVGENDILIHLGDWSFGGFDSIREFRDRIVCKNIHLILGNHDHHIDRNKDNIQSIFSSVNKYLDLTVIHNVGTEMQGEIRFALMHFPIASWDNMARGAIHLHGHVHFSADKRIGPGKMMDVGVDGNGLTPISLTEVRSIMRDRPIKSLFSFDHHEIVENYSYYENINIIKRNTWSR